MFFNLVLNLNVHRRNLVIFFINTKKLQSYVQGKEPKNKSDIIQFLFRKLHMINAILKNYIALI